MWASVSGFEYLSGVLLLYIDWYFLFFVALMSCSSHSVTCCDCSVDYFAMTIEWNISDPLEACQNTIVDTSSIVDDRGVSPGLMHNFLKIYSS